MLRARTLVSAIAGVIVLLIAITLFALEGREVVVLRTFTANGGRRETRTWIADTDGTVLIEAASPERPFLQDIQQRPDVELQRGGTQLRCHATPLPNPQGHDLIRRLLLQKYGWADRWVARLTDTSRSVAIRLECAAP